MVSFVFALIALLVVASQAFPAPPHPEEVQRVHNLMGYAIPHRGSHNFYGFHPQYPHPQYAAHNRQRRQLGFGGMGGGMGGGMAGAQAQAQSQSLGTGMGMGGMGLGGLGFNPYMMGMPLIG